MTSNIPTSNSTASLESNANTISSAAPLNPRQTPQKDYAAAFGALQSRYGVVSSHLPPPTTVVNQKKAQTSTPASDSDLATTTKEFKKKRSFLPWRGQGSLGISGSTGEGSGSGGAYSSIASESGSKKSEGAKEKRSIIPWNSGG